jgi:hypothetical protein
MMLRRSVMAVFLGTILVGGPMQSLTAAQEPSPGSGTEQGPKRADAYDIGAGFANVAWIPTKAAWCGVSAGFGLVVLLVTFGAAREWVTSVLDEGCVQKWLLTGADLRPPSFDSTGYK